MNRAVAAASAFLLLALVTAGLPGTALAQPAVTTADATHYVLNRHYRRLTPVQPTSSGPDRVEVAVLFRYDVADGRELESALQAWLASATAAITLTRTPLIGDGQSRLLARAYYTAEALGHADSMHTALYREVGDNGAVLDGEFALRLLFERFGVDGEDFEHAFNSLAVHAQLQRAAELSHRYRSEIAPAVVINGKYTTDVAMAGDIGALIDIVTQLTARELAGG